MSDGDGPAPASRLLTPAELDAGRSRLLKFRAALGGILLGQETLLDLTTLALAARGHLLLEAMQERRVTVLGETHLLPSPFFVLATQNPIELEGTYPLPEAQLDRFLLKVDVPSVGADVMTRILLERRRGATPATDPVLSA